MHFFELKKLTKNIFFCSFVHSRVGGHFPELPLLNVQRPLRNKKGNALLLRKNIVFFLHFSPITKKLCPSRIYNYGVPTLSIEKGVDMISMWEKNTSHVLTYSSRTA